MTPCDDDPLRALERRLAMRFDAIDQSLAAFTQRFDDTENRVADIHLVHARIKREEAAYAKHYSDVYAGGHTRLLPDGVHRDLTDSDNSEEDDGGGDDDDEFAVNLRQTNRWRPGHIGPIGTGPSTTIGCGGSLCKCCVLQ